jgi:hypothetical protein
VPAQTLPLSGFACSTKQSVQNITVLTHCANVPYEKMYKELGAPEDKTGYTIANAPTKGWNHGELFSLYPKTEENKNIQIMEVTWDSGEFMIVACFHMINGTNRCLVAKRIEKGIRF